MIEGLKIDVKSDELRRLLTERLTHNKERLAYWQDQRGKVEKSMGPLDEEVKHAYGKLGSGASPLDTIDQNIGKYRRAVIYYGFMAEHVVANETYRLSESDLDRLKITVDRYSLG